MSMKYFFDKYYRQSTRLRYIKKINRIIDKHKNNDQITILPVITKYKDHDINIYGVLHLGPITKYLFYHVAHNYLPVIKTKIEELDYVVCEQVIPYWIKSIGCQKEFKFCREMYDHKRRVLWAKIFKPFLFLNKKFFYMKNGLMSEGPQFDIQEKDIFKVWYHISPNYRTLLLGKCMYPTYFMINKIYNDIGFKILHYDRAEPLYRSLYMTGFIVATLDNNIIPKDIPLSVIVGDSHTKDILYFLRHKDQYEQHIYYQIGYNDGNNYENAFKSSFIGNIYTLWDFVKIIVYIYSGGYFLIEFIGTLCMKWSKLINIVEYERMQDIHIYNR